ncbi:aldo/keto reductase family oxidoreductase [uncultured Vibrio sp.]|uniref:aldo/keto reductase n=1 Tax=uncultured Vibrio sp. TaxID=114054 RepID=UPI0025EAAC69|nr:aldo/keto reductase [uncultured Vibrio sp.]
MKQYPINKHLPNASQISYGCMGLGGGWNNNSVSSDDVSQARQVIETALEANINLFDHADIYTFGKAETAFGEVLKQTPSLRDKIYIQSKCGIRFEDQSVPGRYDFSADWVTHSVHKSLERLHTESLDILLLHRPDPLMDVEELASTLNTLHQAGKIQHLGVSNMSLHQIQFLQSHLDMPIIANQIEMSLAKLDWVNEGVMVGSEGDHKNNYTAGTIEHCRLNNIQIQAWGCLAQGAFSQQGLDSEYQHIRETTEYVMALSQKYSVPSEAIVLAFLLRHPAHIQPVIGTTNIERIKASSLATGIQLTREEWYSLFIKARDSKLP